MKHTSQLLSVSQDWGKQYKACATMWHAWQVPEHVHMQARIAQPRAVYLFVQCSLALAI